MIYSETLYSECSRYSRKDEDKVLCNITYCPNNLSMEGEKGICDTDGIISEELDRVLRKKEKSKEIPPISKVPFREL